MGKKIEDRIGDVFKWCIEDHDLVNSKICDIGVGAGLSSIYFAAKGASKVHGFEPSEGFGGDKSVYNLFTNNIEEYGVNNIVIPHKTDFLENDFEDDTFDYVIAINSLHHVVEKSTDKSNFDGLEIRLSEAIKEMKRITKPNGKVIIWEIAFDSVYRFIGLRYKQMDWYLHPPLKMWKNAAKDSFDNIQLEYTHFFSIPLAKYFMKSYLSLFFLNPTFKLILKKEK
jgi:SAM-dependent methyltransferase